jgi:general secretion pathway protein G
MNLSATYQRLKRQRDAGEISGFTLIELLIVIVVLGILAAVVIFALGGITGKSAQASCAADGATVSTAMAAFKAQNSVTVTQALLLSGTTANGNSPYIQSWPNNTPHYGFVMGTGVGLFGTAGTLYVVTGSDVASGAGTLASPYVYQLGATFNGNLTPGQVAAATTSATAVPALIPYTGPGVCSAPLTAVS